MLLKTILLGLIHLSVFCYGEIYEVPDAKLEVLQPIGFRISIPDQEGVKLFAFHGKINEELNGREGGTFSRDVVTVKNGRWTSYEPTGKLKIGDTLYFWTYVDYFDGTNKLGYPRDNQQIVVGPEHFVEERTKPLGTCEPSITTYNGNLKPSCKDKSIFSENFKTINTKHWTTQRRFAYEPDYEFVIYDDKPEVINLEKGYLSIKPTLSEDIYGEGFPTSRSKFNFGSKCTGVFGTQECSQTDFAFLIKPPVVSAQLSTKNKFSFKYGKIDILAKLPAGDWIYPELFLNPKTEEYGPHYESGQIRIAFIPGNEKLAKVLYGGCVLGNSTAARNFAMKENRREKGWTNGFFRFIVTWTKDKITLTMNNQEYGVIYPPEGGFASQERELDLPSGIASRWRSGSELAPFDQEMYITIGVGVGGTSFDDEIEGKPWVNDDRSMQKNFYRAKSQWYPTWGDQSALEIKHIKVFSV